MNEHPESEAVKVAKEIRARLGDSPNPKAEDTSFLQQLVVELRKELRKDIELRKWCVMQGDNWQDIYNFVTEQSQKAITNLVM